jgi:hypothetical protein
MRIRRFLMVMSAVALPLASVALLEGTASAKSVTEGGTLTCAVGGSASFDPALTPGGEAAPPGPKKEIVTIALSLSGCTSSNANPATPGAPGGTTAVAAKAIKIKATGSPKTVGSCSSFATASATISVKTQERWSNGTKKTKVTLGNLTVAGHGSEIGFDASGTASGSWAGSTSAGAYFTQDSTNAIEACEENTSSAPVSSLNFDNTDSTITFN